MTYSMNTRIRWVLGTILLLGAVSGPLCAQNAEKPELRGMWVTRFEWPDNTGNVEVMKNRIRLIMKTLADNNFNAVFFQVRGQTDTLYPSTLEPWSPLIGGKDPGFDPLAFAIEEAHAKGLEFHAYINAFPCWNSQTPPESKEYFYHKHADWLVRDSKGEPVWEEYYYLSPGNPEVQAHVRSAIMDVVRRYNVDGIHLDRIRYPTSKTMDAVSKARFEGPGNPSKLSMTDWQRAQITLFVSDLYAQIQSVKPQVKLTTSVWGIYDNTKIPGYGGFSSGLHDYNQDSLAWIRAGAVDALVPMIYWDIGGKKPDYDELYRYFLANSSGRHIYGGIQTKYKNAEEPIREIEYTRSVNGPGIVGFSYGGVEKMDRWATYKKVYAQKAPLPEMPWKKNHTAGILIGTVTDASGQKVTDAHVRIPQYPFYWISSGDGLFSILNLPPGPLSLEVEKAGIGKAQIPAVSIEAGRVTQIQVSLKP